MSTLHHESPGTPDTDDLIAQLAAAKGIDPAALRTQLDAAGTAPLVSDQVEAFLALLTKNTRRTYRTHINRLRDGFGPICDTQCESCLDPATGFRYALWVLAAVLAVTHLFDHTNTIRMMSSGLEDLLIGWPMAGALAVVGGIVHGT